MLRVYELIRASVPARNPSADSRRDRYRAKRSRRPPCTRLLAPQQSPLPGYQLRRPARVAGRERAVRSRAGAFSGAVATKIGLLESAQGGTVFLDEIGELSPPVQAKLLRALETRRILRVGDVHERPIDVSDHRRHPPRSEADARAGRFRQDL